MKTMNFYPSIHLSVCLERHAQLVNRWMYWHKQSEQLNEDAFHASALSWPASLCALSRNKFWSLHSLYQDSTLLRQNKPDDLQRTPLTVSCSDSRWHSVSIWYSSLQSLGPGMYILSIDRGAEGGESIMFCRKNAPESVCKAPERVDLATSWFDKTAGDCGIDFNPELF